MYKIYGNETGLTAADRTKGFYTPGAGMPGNELDQVMTGVDYGGTMVTGLLFTQEAGWDKAGWYDFPWDNYGDSRIKAFRADGSTASYTFTTAPTSTEVFQVYLTQDDSTRKKLSDVIFENSSNDKFLILDKKFTVCIIKLGSFGLPLKGTGARYGASVSTNIFSLGISLNVLAKSWDLLNVTTPLAEM